MKMPRFSIIVPNWNGRHFLEVCLSALRRQTFRDFETILVDDGSQDGSAQYVKKNFPEVRIIELKRNVGFCLANIEGYKHARGELIALLNNDTEADSGWLKALDQAASKLLEASSFASKMLYFDDRSKIDNCGFGLSPSGATIDLGRDELNGPAWSQSTPVFGACAGAGIYRRSMLESIGFFDPDFFMTYEDVDLSFRAQLLGYQCMFVPQAIVYHHYRATMRRHPSRQVFLSQRNIEFVYLKNMPMALIVRFLPQRMFYEFGSAIYFALEGNVGSYFLAKFDVLRKLPAMLRKRKTLQRARTRSTAELCALITRGGFGVKWRKLSSALVASAKSALSSREGAV